MKILRNKSRLVLGVAATLMLSGLVFFGAGCPFFQTSLTEIKLATKIDDVSKKPLEVVETYSPDFENIYLTAKLNYGKNDTRVKADWFFRDNKISEDTKSTITASGTRYVSFKLERPSTVMEWPAGIYSVKVYLDDTETQTLSFEMPVKQ